MLLAGTIGVAALVLLAATLSSVFVGGRARASAPPTQTNALRVAANSQADPPPGDPAHSTARFRTMVANRRTCPQVVQAQGWYLNPLAGAHVTPERIDQGVDYAGSGTLEAIGAARLTYVATSGTGWPGAFVEYRLLDGPDSGCYVFYAEGVIPAASLHVGETVGAGQTIATIIPYYGTGIELGWGSGSSTVTYAAEAHQWSPTKDFENTPTPAGESFSALIAFLGGPPGKMEGKPGSG